MQLKVEYSRDQVSYPWLLVDKGWSLGEDIELFVVEGRSLVVVFGIRLLSSCAPVEDQ